MLAEENEGRLRFSPAEPVVADTYTSLTFEYTADLKGPRLGGCFEVVLFTRFSTNLWSHPQKEDPTAPGYVSAQVEGLAHAVVDIHRIPLVHSPHGSTLHIISLSIAGSDLEAGQRITLFYGEKRGGSPGVRVQPLAREVVFPVFLTHQSRGRTFLQQAHSIEFVTVRGVCQAASFLPRLRVIGGKADRICLTVPSIVDSESFDVSAVAVDKHGNRSEQQPRSATILSSDFSVKGKVHFSRGQRAKGRLSVGKVPQTTRILAIDREAEIMGVSNPFRIDKTPRKKKLFWGEIHAHSTMSDALPTIEEHYQYADEVANLDFAAVTDHDADLCGQVRAWDTLKAVAEKYNRPGEFVTLLGYELLVQCGPKMTPHLNIYFPGTEGELISKVNVGQLRTMAKKYGAILIAHHTQYGYAGMGTDWSELESLSSREMPLVEIWSTHGNSEYFGCPFSVKWPKEGRSVQDALKRGMRLGIIAGSDYHETLLGHQMQIPDYSRTVNNAHMQAQTGLTAVFAPALTRREIFTALSRREVYATTGTRILIDFYVNEAHMGTEIRAGAEGLHVKGFVEGTARLSKVEIISGAKTVHRAEIKDESSVIDWRDVGRTAPGSYYYLRVTQEDGHMAWTSPVWIGPPEKDQE